MGEIKNRSVRLDDENFGWLNSLPGRTFNDAVGDLRVSLDGVTQSNADELGERFNRIEGMLAEMPGVEEIQEALREVVVELKAQKGGAQVASEPRQGGSRFVATAVSEGFDPAQIAGVKKGIAGQFPCRCTHSGCRGSKFMGLRRGENLCPSCFEKGHTGEPRNCGPCFEDTGPA
jgi:hypothetical protein